jgi:hypothetical protein
VNRARLVAALAVIALSAAVLAFLLALLVALLGPALIGVTP